MTRVRPATLVRRSPDGPHKPIYLAHDVTTLGRSSTCTVVLDAPTVSRLHASIELQHDRYMLSDAGSANGTFVNGCRLEHGHQLRQDDTIWLGSDDVALSFDDPEATLVLPANNIQPPLSIDEHARSVQVYGVPASLSPLEYQLLLHLATHPGTVCTRESCFLTVWGQTYDPATCEDALNACIARLRRSLRAAAETSGQAAPQIVTVQRVGFRLDAPVAFSQAPSHVAS
jgi:DNA-binding winged helix-turn-helix (wHTH) protein